MTLIFETSRFILRQFTWADNGLLLRRNSDPKLLKYCTNAYWRVRYLQKKFLRTSSANNEFIGSCGLNYRPDLEETDPGFRFIQTARGRGYASEAAIQTIEYGLNELNLAIITGRAHIEKYGVFTSIGKNR